jgi:hypothetical protein
MRVLRPVLAVGFLALLAGQAVAQDDRYATVDVRAGYTQPLGDAKDQLKGQSSFGGGFMLQIANRLRLGASFDFAHHSQKPVIGGPNDRQFQVFHTFVKIAFDLVNQEKVNISIIAGPGMMFFSPNDALHNATGIESDRHFAVNGGATITWWFADRIGIVLSPQADIALSRTTGQVFTDKSAMLFPLTAGFRFKI